MQMFKVCSQKETEVFAEKLGEILNPGDIICLTGNLGAGKTAFTRGLAKALGINNHITSPTFTIVNEYEAEIPLYHFDVYRISSPDDMFEIGFEEYLYGDGVSVIEWADLIYDILPLESINVRIDISSRTNTEERVIEVEFKGNRYLGYEEKLLDKWSLYGGNNEDTCG
ncbi:MAG: tRNA (adenosine(37)-N6)-threonylcarbamoyltransferase complex ATPase subunit type 1 TsaE [Bacillota bacterium]|nr:tRNA (adenosine(37)-N6)-threonylcarbamoyltransferase complex ATPase subunit type 1 TsaE [Bacillota bacterium]